MHKKFGLEFDEDKHRWVHPDTGEEYHADTGELEVSGHSDRPWEEVPKLEDKLENHPNYVRYQDHRDVLDNYVGTPDSWEMNSSLSQGIVSENAKKIKALMKPMVEPFTIYRGITLKTGKFFNDHGEEAKIGDKLSLKGFTSCTRNPKWAKYFPTKHRPHTVAEMNEVPANSPLYAKLTIQTTPDTHGISISAYDLKTGEYETILDYGQQLEILSLEKTDDLDIWLNVRCRIVSNNLELQKAVRKKPQWAEENGLEFNEQHHRWMKPGTDEPHPHPENDSRWEPKPKKKKGVPKEENKNSTGHSEVEYSYLGNEEYNDKQFTSKESKMQNHPAYQNVRKHEDLGEYLSDSKFTNGSIMEGKPDYVAQQVKKLMVPMQQPHTVYRGTGEPTFLK